MKKAGVNWRNWKRLLEFLKTRKPREVDMGMPLDWDTEDDSLTIKDLRVKHCGTVGCIAGWGGVLFSKEITCR